VEGASAESAANYSIDQNITVSASVLGSDLKTVTLTTSGLSEDVDYTLTVNNVRDRANSPNTIAANSQAVFQYTAQLEITNTTVASNASYVWDALAVSKEVYIDRTYTFSTVPAKYNGLQYLMTANNDKAAADNPLITFNVNQPVTVYVGYSGSSLPAWLADWTDTRDDLVTTDRTLRLYSKDFAAGTVSLGNNGTAQSMYTVLVENANGGPVVQVSRMTKPLVMEIEAFPNPFNERTKIAVSYWPLYVGKIKLKIFNINGKLVKTLTANRQQLLAGIAWNAGNLHPGMYMARMQAGSKKLVKKLLLVK
jgi:hypothetical protein